MGAGASIDDQDQESSRYFCHACRRVFGFGGTQNPADYSCPYCYSSFLEEIGTPAQAYESNSIVNSRNVLLNDEQSRRLATSAIMLRLLEAQLRTELQSLTSGLERDAARRVNEEKPKPMTQATLCKLRKTKVDIDMLCSQPSCPVCSEDFQLEVQITQMPCSHIFHASCVLPWLDVKRTCPICRFELTEVVPTIEELELFTESELHDKLLEARAAGDTAVPASTATTMSLATSQLHTLATASSKQAAGSMRGKDESNEPRRELATMLYHLLVDQKSKADAASAVQAQVEEEEALSNHVKSLDTPFQSSNLNPMYTPQEHRSSLGVLRLLSPGGYSMSYQPASSSITMMPMATLSAAGNQHQPLNRGASSAAHMLTGVPQQTHRLGNHIVIGGGLDSSGHSLPGGLASRLVHGDGNAATTIGNDDEDDEEDVLERFATERDRQVERERRQYEAYLRLRGGRDSDDLERRARQAANREIDLEHQMRAAERERADRIRRGYDQPVVARGTGSSDTATAAAAPRVLVVGSAGYGYGQDDQPLSFALRSNRLSAALEAATSASSSSSSSNDSSLPALSSSASESAMMPLSHTSPLRYAQQQLQQSVRGPRYPVASHHAHDPGGVNSNSSGGGPASLRQMSSNDLD